MCWQDTLLKDIIHWKWIGNGDLLFTVLIAKASSVMRRQIDALPRILLLNYPQLLYLWDHIGRVRYISNTEKYVFAYKSNRIDG